MIVKGFDPISGIKSFAIMAGLRVCVNGVISGIGGDPDSRGFS
jgi:hypothetical protein